MVNIRESLLMRSYICSKGIFQRVGSIFKNILLITQNFKGRDNDN